jgi:DNA-binding CsgD family transcriptional regulator
MEKTSRELSVTRRQKEIMQLVAQGLTNLAIARYLGMSSKTVDAHLCSTYRIMGYLIAQRRWSVF